jgi:hypothetical protein
MYGVAEARRLHAACHGTDQPITGLSMSTASLTELPGEARLLVRCRTARRPIRLRH